MTNHKCKQNTKTNFLLLLFFFSKQIYKKRRQSNKNPIIDDVFTNESAQFIKSFC